MQFLEDNFDKESGNGDWATAHLLQILDGVEPGNQQISLGLLKRAAKNPNHPRYGPISELIAARCTKDQKYC
jgi:hypothetical protein